EARVPGEPKTFASPRHTCSAGIAAIHQDTVMFDELTVAEDIVMCHMAVGPSAAVDWLQMRARSAELLKSIDAPIPPDFKLKRLCVAQKHLLEVARALSHEAQFVIMDEPTAALSANEIDDLFRIVAQLKAEGRAIIFISHKFDEIFRIADDFVCLRDGEKVGDGPIGSVTEAQLVRMMGGRPGDQVFPQRDVPS